MKSQNGILLATVLGLALSGCDSTFGPDSQRLRGSGRIVEESRSVRDFSAIELSGAGSLVIVQGRTESLTIEADNNILPFVRSDIEGRTLVLGLDFRGSVSTSRRIRYQLSVRDLDDIQISGASDVSIDYLDTRELYVNMSGASSLRIAGIVDVQVIDMSGASRFEGMDFESLATDVNASGASTAIVNVLDQLDARLSGASWVQFVGRPRVFESVSGGSWVGRY